MAIVLCKECGKEMSDTAKVCPHCGYDYTAKARAKKRSGCSKALIMVLVFLAIVWYLGSKTTAEDQSARQDKIAKIKEEHCKLDWSKLNHSEKERVLQEFIDADPEDIHSAMYSLIRASAKYPGTVDNGTLSSKIVNVDNGIIEYDENFEAENALKMKVRGNAYYKLQYHAGCKPSKIVSVDIE